MKSYKQHKSKTKAILIVIFLAILISSSVFCYFFWQKKNITITDKQAKTTSTSKTAQSNYTNGQNHQQSNSNNISGTSIDQKGNNTNTTINTPSNEWTISSSGLITVKQPSINSTLKLGDTLRGSAQTPSINYTLADNISGIISQGVLSVVDGNFSGTLSFTAKGTNGQLSVFSFDPTTGAEINIVNIAVKF